MNVKCWHVVDLNTLYFDPDPEIYPKLFSTVGNLGTGTVPVIDLEKNVQKYFFSTTPFEKHLKASFLELNRYKNIDT